MILIMICMLLFVIGKIMIMLFMILKIFLVPTLRVMIWKALSLHYWNSPVFHVGTSLSSVFHQGGRQRGCLPSVPCYTDSKTYTHGKLMVCRLSTHMQTEKVDLPCCDRRQT